MDADLIKEFAWSTREDVQTLDELLLAAEQGRQADDDIHAIYRIFHSLKGAAGLVQLPALEQAAHQGEDLLDTYRKSGATLSQDVITLLFIFIDGVKALLLVLDQLEQETTEDPALYALFHQQLALLQAGEQLSVPLPSAHYLDADVVDVAEISAASVGADGENEVADNHFGSPEGMTVSDSIMTDVTTASEAATIEAQATLPSASVPAPVQRAAAEQTAETAIRVDVHLLDRLMNLVGELVLTRNHLLNVVAESDNPMLLSASQSLDQVTSELQENIMRTRMQPIGNIFNKFPRILRDLSNQLNKKVELAINGKETELDRTLLEAMRDPFTHILRNSIDHGVETPEQRLASGKTAHGTIQIKAYHEGGQVIVEVADDGKGINPAVIKEKAVQSGLISADQASSMSDQEAVMLVCKPGFSTAESITNISGRGVGMDVVRSNIERIGGSLDIISVYGSGTTIRIKVPLTLAIIPALIVGAQGELFGIPQINLVELVGVDAADCADGFETIRGVEVFRLRERLLTIVRLCDLLQMPATEPEEGKMLFIVVVAAGDQQFGLVVEDIYDTEEIVVKPLSRHLNSIEHYAGATIRGDGRAALILDMPGIARAVGMDTNLEDLDATDEQLNVESHCQEDFLVFHLGQHEQMAIPLQLVARIEQYPVSALSQVNGADVICHEQKLTPIVHVPKYSHFKEMDITQSDSIFVIIVNVRDGIGIVAQDLIDSIPIDLEQDLLETQFMGSDIVSALSVVNGVPTALLDVHALIDHAYPPVTAHAVAGNQAGHVLTQHADGVADSCRGRILFCDDAQFFRNTVSGYLHEAGYQVDMFENGEQAIAQLQQAEYAYDLVLTDLEMPVLDGWEVIKFIRALPAYDHLPVIALTSLDDEMVHQHTLQCGANGYALKLSKDELLALVAQHLQKVHL